MPVFHTKTIESILEPVANQVTTFQVDTFPESATNEKQQLFLPMSISKNNFLEKSDSYKQLRKAKRKSLEKKKTMCSGSREKIKLFARFLEDSRSFSCKTRKKVYINAKSQKITNTKE